MSRRHRAQMIVVGNAIVIASRAYRSKWWTLACGCPASRRRKDGSCEHQRLVLDRLTPSARARTRIDPVQMGERRSGAAA